MVPCARYLPFRRHANYGNAVASRPYWYRAIPVRRRQPQVRIDIVLEVHINSTRGDRRGAASSNSRRESYDMNL